MCGLLRPGWRLGIRLRYCYCNAFFSTSPSKQVTIGDFSRYLRSVGERLEVLERSREASQQRMQEALSPGASAFTWAACATRLHLNASGWAAAAIGRGAYNMVSMCSCPQVSQRKASQGQGLVAAVAECVTRSHCLPACL